MLKHWADWFWHLDLFGSLPSFTQLYLHFMPEEFINAIVMAFETLSFD